MSKLYVFAIGGTGSRVLKALTMLLAAGVKTKISEIVPIIIDPDTGCGDKTDTVSLMKLYSTLYDMLSHHTGSPIDAFSAKLTRLPFPNEYVMPMGANTNVPFGEYMNFGSLDYENQALVNMLFSVDNQKADMTIGFTGNPNIGSVVLNQFTKSQQFQTFANDFAANDKIFIISSIFGGSGASGFPLLLKNLRNIPAGMPNAAAISTAEIGAISVLPYFNVTSKADSPIDSSSFISKTKAALSYYERNLAGLNALYYIGDDVRGQQDNNKGGASQKNDAHFIELAAALSVIDFADNHFPPGATIYKEFGIDNDSNNIIFPDLNATTYHQIAKPLTEFTLFCKFLSEKLSSSSTQSWYSDYASVVGNPTYNGTIVPFTKAYLNWIAELEDHAHHARAFSPFVLTSRPNDVFGLVKGINTKKVFGLSASNWDLVNHFLNKSDCAKKANSVGLNSDGKFLAHLIYGIRKVVSEKITL